MTAPLVTPSRGEALAAFFVDHGLGAAWADALLASGVVRAADTLADDEALVERVRGKVYDGRRYVPPTLTDTLRALAAALEDR